MIVLNAQDILYEYGKGLEEPIYVIENYFKTFDKTQETNVPFKLFPRQKDIITGYESYRYNLVTKPRQAGVSTVTAAYLSVKVAWAEENNPEKILILANKQDLAMEFLSKIKGFLQQLPRWVWGGEYYGSAENEAKDIFITNSKKHLTLPNGSQVRALATSKDALRGYTPTRLVMDEAAFIDGGAEVFAAAQSALSTGGKCTLISTPGGYDELYHHTYDTAKKGENDFNIIEMRWHEDLRYNKDLEWIKGDLKEKETEFTFKSYQRRLDDGWKPTSKWYRDMCRSLNNDKRKIAQELDVSFLGSGGNVIDEEYIEYIEKNDCCDPSWVAGLQKDIWIWKKPVVGHRYILSADVARGDGEDSSAFVIIDFTTLEQVVDYKGKLPPDMFAQLIEEYAIIYNAYTVVDITGGMGVATVLKLLEYDFPNKLLHYDEPRGRVLKTDDLTKYKKGNKTPGFNAQSVRLPMISLLEETIRMNKIKLYSRRLTSEMRTFVYLNGRPDHMKGRHDDVLMCLAMGVWVLEHSFKKLEKLESQSKAMLGGWLNSSQLVDDGVLNKDVKKKVNGFVSNNYSPNNASGNYLWLFSGMK